MSKFKVGDKVRIAKSSEYYSKDISNPNHLNGEVIKLFNNKEYNNQVKWDNGSNDIYRESDLELVEQKPQFKVGHGAICIKKTHGHNVGDVLLIEDISRNKKLIFQEDITTKNPNYFTPCPNPPRPHYKERIAYALGADIETQHIDWSWSKVTKPQFYEADNYRVAIPDIHAEKREQLQAEIERLQGELDSKQKELHCVDANGNG